MRPVTSFLRLLSVSRIAIMGAVLVTTGIATELLLLIGELFFFESHPYIGIVTYFVLPGMVVTGLAFIPAGLWLRVHRAKVAFSLAAIESIAERRGIGIAHAGQVIAMLSLVNLVIFGVVGYRAFHYTESVAFCGQLCHKVMHPEYEVYSRSPHSEIACVQCHIGPGAGWFVKSKLSGARQLVAVVANTYSRPIETPVHNLRPAREVCEICHRPEIFHGNLLKVLEHFDEDEQNTHTYTVLNMRVGGGEEKGREAHGIHWHVSRTHQVRYRATDRKREKIDWVEMTDDQGNRRVWSTSDHPVADPDPKSLRVMDCVDCHNRPTHIYLSPERALDEWMSTGRLDSTAPWIRKLAMEVLSPHYESEEDAMAGIARLPELYEERYPEHWRENSEIVQAAVPVIQEIHRSFVFPDMNIQWNTYNSLIGHANAHTQACFRCHNGLLRDESGVPITLDCNACHFILADREASPRILDRLERR